MITLWSTLLNFSRLARFHLSFLGLHSLEIMPFCDRRTCFFQCGMNWKVRTVFNCSGDQKLGSWSSIQPEIESGEAATQQRSIDGWGSNPILFSCQSFMLPSSTSNPILKLCSLHQFLTWFPQHEKKWELWIPFIWEKCWWSVGKLFKSCWTDWDQ